MRKTLTQEEIDALFSAAQNTPKTKSAPKKTYEPYDLRQSRKLDSEHVQILTTLHETLARRLGNSLGAYLRVGFDMNLVSIEQLTYREFMTRIPELTYCASLHILPIDARAVFQTDLSLVFPIVDVILGGSGTDPIAPRDLTEIEEQIFETVVGLIVRDLQITWAPVLQLDIQFEQRQQHAQVQGLMLPMEKILSLCFEIRLSEAHGSINLAFPAVIANALMRKLSVQWTFSGPLPSRETRRQIRQRLLDGRFETTLSLPPSGVTVRELISLEVGSVLVLPRRAQDPAHLNVAGKPMFLAYPVRHARRRGARIEQRLSLIAPSGPSEKETK
jgi:flagellar motor switch protein FliM